MPNCIQLIDRVTKRPTPVGTIDRKLCAHLNVPCSETGFYLNWFAVLGPLMASGISLSALAARPDFADILPVITYLDERYTQKGWFEHKQGAKPIASLLLSLALFAVGCVDENPTAAYRRMLYEQCDFLTPTLVTVSARPGAEAWKCQAIVTDYNRIFELDLVYIDPPTDIESARR